MSPVDVEVDPLALERQVCFALAVTHRAVLAIYRPLLEPLGLTHPKYLVMLALWDHHKNEGDRPLSVKEIAATLQLDSATLSPMLKRLEAMGLITRTRSATDERATDVALTKAGLQLRRRALKIPPSVIDRLGVSLDELEHLHDVLVRVNTAALAAGALDNDSPGLNDSAEPNGPNGPNGKDSQ
jgi:DNA-binding MarR family transcriptional regulator